MSASVKELSGSEKPALERHFLALGNDDRRLRFGIALQDPAIASYVEGLDFDRDAVFGVLDDELRIIGAAHLARSGGHAELGVSVLPGHRDLGVGGALLARAHLHARNWGVRELFMHCLTENSPMMHLARKNGMEVVTASGESDAWLKLPPADTASHTREALEEQVAFVDHAQKSQVADTRHDSENPAGGNVAKMTADQSGIDPARDASRDASRDVKRLQRNSDETPSMNMLVNESLHLRLLIGVFAAMLIGSFGMAARAPWTQAVASESDGSPTDEIRATSQAGQAQNSAAREGGSARVKTKCPECGIVESTRPIGQLGAESDRGAARAPTEGAGSEIPGTTPKAYEVTVRMTDGSTQVFTDANPANWRSGQRVILIAGTSPSND